MQINIARKVSESKSLHMKRLNEKNIAEKLKDKMIHPSSSGEESVIPKVVCADIRTVSLIWKGQVISAVKHNGIMEKRNWMKWPVKSPQIIMSKARLQKIALQLTIKTVIFLNKGTFRKYNMKSLCASKAHHLTVKLLSPLKLLGPFWTSRAWWLPNLHFRLPYLCKNIWTRNRGKKYEKAISRQLSKVCYFAPHILR